MEEEGNYSLVFTAGMDAEGGSFRVRSGESYLAFQGGDFIDLHTPHRVLSRNFRSGPVKLNKGENPIILKPAEGNNGKIKIDFIWVMKLNQW